MRMPESVLDQQEDEFELPVSMIDVVFLLLIFFMCATTFRIDELSLGANMNKGGQNPPPDPVPPPTLRLYVRQDGRVLLNQTLLDDSDDLYRRVAAIVHVRRDASILLGADPKVHFHYVVTTYDTAVRAGVTDIRFQAPPKDRTPHAGLDRM